MKKLFLAFLLVLALYIFIKIVFEIYRKKYSNKGYNTVPAGAWEKVFKSISFKGNKK